MSRWIGSYGPAGSELPGNWRRSDQTFALASPPTSASEETRRLKRIAGPLGPAIFLGRNPQSSRAAGYRIIRSSPTPRSSPSERSAETDRLWSAAQCGSLPRADRADLAPMSPGRTRLHSARPADNHHASSSGACKERRRDRTGMPTPGASTRIAALRRQTGAELP